MITMAENEKKAPVTKKENIRVLKALVNAAKEMGVQLGQTDITFEDLRAYLENEEMNLEKRSEQAKKRAEEKREIGDALREQIWNILSYDNFTPINDVVTKLDNPEVSAQMVTARLSQLVELNRAERTSITVEIADTGKHKKVSAYKKVGG